jgi:glycosyltransferase involved in cell wall biosynthesis
VIVDEEIPYPPTSGKRIRTLNLVTRLAQRHRITYLCHRNLDSDEALKAKAFFDEHLIETLVVDRPRPRKSGMGFCLRLAANLFSRLPYSVASHTSRAMRERAVDIATKGHVDLWHCEWTPYAESIRDVVGQRHVIMAHNVESQIWQRYHETERNVLKRWYIKRQWRKFRAFERRAFADATGVVTVSRPDAELAISEFGARQVCVVDNGVDTHYFRPGTRERSSRKILFLGSLDWRPNQYAVELLLDTIFPMTVAEEPSAELCIVGRNPPERLVRLIRSTPKVMLAANVGDVRPYLADSAVMVVPLRVGGGSRLKILEALATGLPVVSTSIGAEGLDLIPGQHFILADDPAAMARALVDCIRHPARLRGMAEEGRRVVATSYDWDALADKLEQAWLEYAGGT